MPITCPLCQTSLPEHEGFLYRFCPNCGAEINLTSKDLKGAADTIPPVLDAARKTASGRKSVDKETEPVFNGTSTQTLPPAQLTRRNRPDIKPPEVPPPPSFYRQQSTDMISNSEIGKKNSRKILKIGGSALAVFLGLILLIWGIYAVFLQ